MIGRRKLLALGASSLAAATAARLARAAPSLVPCGFVSHGSPLLATDPVRGPELRAWGRTLPPATAIVSLTPHYRGRGLRIGHVGKGRALRSFPRFMSRMVPEGLDYPSPDNAALARVVADLLAPLEPTFDRERAGFDHTTWMPLLHLFPKADVPVLEIAMPFTQEHELFALGRRLAPLRYQNVFLLASGGVTHNLASIRMDAPRDAKPPPWAEAFDAWTKKTLAAGDVASLLDWRARAPKADLAHPDDGGHFRVMLVALGFVARGDGADAIGGAKFPVEGFEAGTQSKRCVELF
jgi:4,5-DOPA dioxygenase extradiol